MLAIERTAGSGGALGRYFMAAAQRRQRAASPLRTPAAGAPAAAGPHGRTWAARGAACKHTCCSMHPRTPLVSGTLPWRRRRLAPPHRRSTAAAGAGLPQCVSSGAMQCYKNEGRHARGEGRHSQKRELYVYSEGTRGAQFCCFMAG